MRFVEKIVVLVQQLKPEYRLRVIQRITETLIPPSISQEAKPLQFGKYKGNRKSTPEGLRIPELHDRFIIKKYLLNPVPHHFLNDLVSYRRSDACMRNR
jgi:hypothetical protein